MEQQIEKLDISKYWGILRRRYGWGLTLFLVVSITAVVFAVLIPDKYRSECILVVRTEDEELLEATMRNQPKITSTVARIEAIMLDPKNLQAAAKAAHMEEELGEKKNDKFELHLLYRKLAKDVKVEPLGERLVRIAYEADSTDKAHAVVDELVSCFREDILGKKAETYERKAKNKQEEVIKLQKEMAKLGRDYDNFLREHSERMYDLHLIKQRELAALKSKLLENKRELDAAKKRRDNWDRELETIEETLPQRELPGQRDIVRSRIERQLADAKVHLEKLHISYTDKHPRVKDMEDFVRSLEDELAKRAQVEETASREINRDFTEARRERFEEGVKIDMLTNERDDIQRRIEVLMRDLKEMPKNRAKAEEFKRKFSGLARELSKAKHELREANELLEGSRSIKYFDKEREPTEPEVPERSLKLQILIAGLFAAVALGIGAMFGVEYIDQSFTDVNDARQFLMIPALGTIPTIMTRSDRRRRLAFRLLMLLIVAGISAGAFAVYRNVPAVQRTVDGFWRDIVSMFQGIVRL